MSQKWKVWKNLWKTQQSLRNQERKRNSMEVAIIVLSVAVTTFMNILCFMIGVKTAQKVNRDEEVKLPSINPIEIIKEHREAKEAELEQERYNTMLENINNYSGDATGQKDLPR